MFNVKWKVMADYGTQTILGKFYPQDPVCLSSWWSKSIAKRLATVLQAENPRYRYYIERIK